MGQMRMLGKCLGKEPPQSKLPRNLSAGQIPKTRQNRANPTACAAPGSQCLRDAFGPDLGLGCLWITALKIRGKPLLQGAGSAPPLA